MKLVELGGLAYLGLYVADAYSSDLNAVDSFHKMIADNLEIAVLVLAMA